MPRIQVTPPQTDVEYLIEFAAWRREMDVRWKGVLAWYTSSAACSMSKRMWWLECVGRIKAFREMFVGSAGYWVRNLNAWRTYMTGWLAYIESAVDSGGGDMDILEEWKDWFNSMSAWIDSVNAWYQEIEVALNSLESSWNAAGASWVVSDNAWRTEMQNWLNSWPQGVV